MSKCASKILSLLILACLLLASGFTVPIAANAAGDWPVNATIRNENGGAVLRINGVPTIPLILWGNTMKQVPDHTLFNEEVEKAKQRGMNMLMWVNVLNDMNWNRQVNEDILSHNNGAYIIIRLGIGDTGLYMDDPSTPENEYIGAGEWAITDTGHQTNYWPSLASAKWRERYQILVTKYLDWLRQQPYANKVIGFQLMNMYTGEWFVQPNELVANNMGRGDDYSQPMVAAFRAWLQEKYGTVEALRTAWNKVGSNLTFANAEIPSADQKDDSKDSFFRVIAQEGQVIDYQTFYSEYVARTIDFVSSVIKQQTGNKALVGVMYGYPYMFSGYVRPSNTGHYGLNTVLDSPNVDFVGSPIFYNQRRPGDNADEEGPFGSVPLHGKMVITENDTVTHVVEAPDYPWPNDKIEWGDASRTFTLDGTINAIRRDTANQIILGGGTYLADIYNHGWFNVEEVWDEYQKLMSLHASKTLISKDRSFKPEVAFIYDEDSVAYHTLTTNILTPSNNPYVSSEVYGFLDFNNDHLFQKQTRELARSGVSYGYYQLSDIQSLPDSVKVVVFQNTYRITPEQKTAIDGLKNKNRTLVFLRAPGYLSENDSNVQYVSDLVGMNMSKANWTEAATVVTNPTDPAVSGSGISGFGGSSISEVTGTNEPVYRITPSFHVTDASAVALGHYEGDTGKVSFARKNHGNWTSIFSGSNCLPAALIRSIAHNVGGAHVYYAGGSNGTDDNIRTDGRIIMMHSRAGNSGSKTIHLPVPSRVVDVNSNKTLADNTTSFSFPMAEKSTALFVVTPAEFTHPVQMESGSVTKTGSWAVEGGTSVYSQTAGDQVTFTAKGGYLSILANGGPNRGRLGVTVDGVEYPYIETYHATAGPKEYVIAQNLPNGNHTVTLTVKGEKHRNSTGKGINLDAYITSKDVKPIGYVDYSDSTLIKGWVADPNIGAEPVDVHVYVDGVPVKALRANEYRPDVPLNSPGVQGDYHGFSWVPTGITPGNHTVQIFGINDVYYAGLNAELSGSPVEWSTKSWDFNASAENWTANPSVSNVSVTGGHFDGAITGADPYLVSGDNLGLTLGKGKRFIKIKFKNGSNATTAQLYFTTVTDPSWGEAKHKDFAVLPNQSGYTEYTIDMSDVAGWTGTLKQLRFDPAAGVQSGSFSIDSVQITY